MSQLPATILQYFKVWRPRTPGLANKRMVRTDDMHQGPPIPSLLSRLDHTAGRSTLTGRITIRHRGGGDKLKYRLVDWTRHSMPGRHTVMRIEQDPNRSARLALLKHQETQKLSYILAVKGMNVGDVVQRGANVAPDRGNCLPLSAIPVGTLIHNVGLRPGEAGKLSRAAGTYCQLLRTQQEGMAQVKLSSGEIRHVPVDAYATVGTVSNPFHKLQILGTAGANRRRGRRPAVRGVAMNACDHPMGGKGKRRGIPSTSPWGKMTKGVFTVKKHLQKMVIRARPTRNARKKQPVRKFGGSGGSSGDLDSLISSLSSSTAPVSADINSAK